MCIVTKKLMTTATTTPTTMPRVAPPSAMPRVSSWAVSGGIRVSTMLPCTLAMTIDDEVLAKAFCRIDIINRPGARNSMNGTPATSPRPRPRARVNTARNSSVVTTGARTVWV